MSNLALHSGFQNITGIHANFLPALGFQFSASTCKKGNKGENKKFWQWLRRVKVDCNEWQRYDISSSSLGEIEPECTEAQAKMHCTLQTKDIGTI